MQLCLIIKLVVKAMNKVKKCLQQPMFWFIFTLVLYVLGFILMKSPDAAQLKEAGLAEREEYIVTNQDGEESMAESLLDINGLGKVLTYKDIYLFSIPLFFASLFLGCIIFNGGEISTSRMDMKHAIFANCILGILLIWLTSKANIPSTVLFWLGIFTTGIGVFLDINATANEPAD